MKHKIAGTKHKDRQQGIATKQGQKKKQSQETKTTARTHQPPHDRLVPSTAYPERGHGICSAREVKEERERSDRGETPEKETEGGRSIETPEKETEASREARGKRREAQHSSWQLPAAPARIGEAENQTPTRWHGDSRQRAPVSSGRAKSERPAAAASEAKRGPPNQNRRRIAGG